MSDNSETKVKRSADFRAIPAESFNLVMSDNGVKLNLGVDETDGSVTELVSVHLTHRIAKMMADTLTRAISDYEERTGKEVEIPESFITLKHA